MSIDEIYRIFKECSGVTTDSRSTKENNLFFGLKGYKFNGNEYARKAIENGAKYAIIDEKTHDIDNRYILVKNSLETLQKLSNLHRKKSNVKKIVLFCFNCLILHYFQTRESEKARSQVNLARAKSS